jgi:hypothetical protein
MPTKARTATRAQVEKHGGTSERGMWLLTSTQKS